MSNGTRHASLGHICGARAPQALPQRRSLYGRFLSQECTFLTELHGNEFQHTCIFVHIWCGPVVRLMRVVESINLKILGVTHPYSLNSVTIALPIASPTFMYVYASFP